MSLTLNLHSNAILEYEDFTLELHARTQVLFLEEPTNPLPKGILGAEHIMTFRYFL